MCDKGTTGLIKILSFFVAKNWWKSVLFVLENFVFIEANDTVFCVFSIFPVIYTEPNGHLLKPQSKDANLKLRLACLIAWNQLCLLWSNRSVILQFLTPCLVIILHNKRTTGINTFETRFRICLNAQKNTKTIQFFHLPTGKKVQLQQLILYCMTNGDNTFDFHFYLKPPHTHVCVEILSRFSWLLLFIFILSISSNNWNRTLDGFRLIQCDPMTMVILIYLNNFYFSLGHKIVFA